MNLRKIIGTGLLFLLVFNSAFLSAGSFFMCLHHAGETHRVQGGSADDCCHPAEAVSEQMHSCEGCTDLEVVSVELLPWRDHGRLLDRAAMSSMGFDWTNEVIFLKPVPYAYGLLRAPPIVEPMSIRFAQTVCLRI